MRISYVNIFDDCTIVVSSANANYPAVNLQHPHLSRSWRGTGASVETITFLTSTLNPDCAYLAGTNLSATAVVKIQGNATDVWTSPTVDITMSKVGDIYYSYSSSFAAMNYWRFSITDTANTDGYIEVGRAWIGANVTVQGPGKSFVEKRINTTKVSTTNSGQTYSNINYTYKSWEMAYPYWTNTEKGYIETFADAVDKSQPLFVQFADTGSNTLGPYYCIMTNDIDFTHIKTLNVWAGQLNFRECF